MITSKAFAGQSQLREKNGSLDRKFRLAPSGRQRMFDTPVAAEPEAKNAIAARGEDCLAVEAGGHRVLVALGAIEEHHIVVAAGPVQTHAAIAGGGHDL